LTVTPFLRSFTTPLVVGHGHGDHRGAAGALDVGGGDGQPVDPAVAGAAALGPQPDLVRRRAELRVGRGVAAARAVDGLVLGHPGDGHGDGVAVGIGRSVHADGDHLEVGRPQPGENGSHGRTGRRGVVVGDGGVVNDDGGGGVAD